VTHEHQQREFHVLYPERQLEITLTKLHLFSY